MSVCRGTALRKPNACVSIAWLRAFAQQTTTGRFQVAIKVCNGRTVEVAFATSLLFHSRLLRIVCGPELGGWSDVLVAIVES